MANKSDNLIKLKNNRITTPPFILIDHKKDNSIIIEKYFKSPQDIEWGIKNNSLYILQSRNVNKDLNQENIFIKLKTQHFNYIFTYLGNKYIKNTFDKRINYSPNYLSIINPKNNIYTTYINKRDWNTYLTLKEKYILKNKDRIINNWFN